MTNRQNIKKTAELAILTAIVIAFQLLGSFIHIGPTSISLVLIPIVIGAVLTGPKGGAFLGFVFGAMTYFASVFGRTALRRFCFQPNLSQRLSSVSVRHLCRPLRRTHLPCACKEERICGFDCRGCRRADRQHRFVYSRRLTSCKRHVKCQFGKLRCRRTNSCLFPHHRLRRTELYCRISRQSGCFSGH